MMSITIGDTLLNYKINDYKINDYKYYKYIITYIEEYNTLLDTYLNKICKSIFPDYAKGVLSYSNVCGNNAEFICNKLLNITELKTGKIIITDWVTKKWDTKNDELIKTIELVYGPIGFTIGESYHALAYLEVIIQEKEYYVAIETTICVPYQLQFYVGSTIEDFEKIIKTRYQCINFKISYDCDKNWTVIAYNSGGKNKKTKKRKTKKRKNKRKTRKFKRRRTNQNQL
uniref:Uncharacterized protein n=1 Tax=viral metagenome TaxID=1070528 RepID=A0A6C0EF58_9ZZZZ